MKNVTDEKVLNIDLNKTLNSHIGQNTQEIS